MVRITLPNRLKSYTGGTNSANHSRSTSPNPSYLSSNMKKSSAGGGTDGSPEKAGSNGLMLKVVVLKVCPFSQTEREGDGADGG